MSLLNQIFNRGLIGQKGKTCLTLAISRIKLLQNKREGQLKLMRKEIAHFLLTGQEAIARIRVEHVIREQKIWDAYEILEMFCEFILARIPILESQRECPAELREAVASVIFAAPRCSDLPDLLHVRNLFSSKYGKEFISAASELRPDTSVNRTIVEKLSASSPSAEAKLKVLKEIAKEHNLQWDSFTTEAELSKKPEDLLNGPKPLASPSEVVSGPAAEKSQRSLDSSVRSRNVDQGGQVQKSTPSTSSSLSVRTSSEPSVHSHKSTLNTQTSTKSPPSDALEKARAAIAAAERASAAARLAANLVNVKLSSPNLEETKG